ncbi:hypothetical protein CPB86DRAFT_788444 [Serendipita vermifera]|nr:hypothetical protein CPB86DRAFT_788444 [Serendipita vermifera]
MEREEEQPSTLSVAVSGILSRRFHNTKNLTPQQKRENEIKEIDHVFHSLLQFYPFQPPIDPLDKLPVEIVQRIIYLALYRENEDIFGHPYDRHNSLVLLSISKRWRQVLLGMPLLWSTIVINPSRFGFNFEGAVRHCLQYSREVPIDVIIYVPSREEKKWDTLRRHFGQNLADRIKTIAFRASSTYSAWHDRNVSSTMIDLLKGLMPLPNLVSLSFSDAFANDVADTVLSGMTSEFLRQLRQIEGPTREILRRCQFQHLSRLKTAMDIDTFVSFQTNMKMLTHVKMSPNRYSPKGATLPAYQTNEKPLGWRYLLCYAEDAARLPYFTSRLTGLITLDLWADHESIGQILLHLHQLSQLQHLNLDFQHPFYSESESLPDVKDIQPNDRVTTLQFTYRTNQPIPTDQAEKLLIHHQDIIAKALPALEKLRVDLPFWAVSSRFFEELTFPRLRDLQVFTHGEDWPKWHLELPTSLQTVRISCFEDFWTSFSSRTATQLHLDVQVKKTPYCKGGLFPPFVPEEWPSLSSLTIPSFYLPKCADELCSLKDLSLASLKLNKDCLGDTVTRFCCHLARNPTSLPSLESLTLYDIPQWDIYFLMLKRRAGAVYGRISPLKVLGLQERFPQQLYRPIMDLISRNNPHSEWNIFEALSIHSALPVLQNRSVQGCIACLLCFRPCTRPAKQWLSPLNPLKGHYFRYPTTEEAILSRWEDLNEYYQSFLPHGLPRWDQCDRQNKIIHYP